MIVMDTCAVIWDALDNRKLTTKAKRAIENADEKNQLLICDISIWEIAILIKRNRLQIDDTPSNFVKLILQSRNYTVMSITPEIAELSVSLDDNINKDPADRIIVATSILNNSPIITSDQNLIDANIVDTVW